MLQDLFYRDYEVLMLTCMYFTFVLVDLYIKKYKLLYLLEYTVNTDPSEYLTDLFIVVQTKYLTGIIVLLMNYSFTRIMTEIQICTSKW